MRSLLQSYRSLWTVLWNITKSISQNSYPPKLTWRFRFGGRIGMDGGTYGSLGRDWEGGQWLKLRQASQFRHEASALCDGVSDCPWYRGCQRGLSVSGERTWQQCCHQEWFLCLLDEPPGKAINIIIGLQPSTAGVALVWTRSSELGSSLWTRIASRNIHMTWFLKCMLTWQGALSRYSHCTR